MRGSDRYSRRFRTLVFVAIVDAGCADLDARTHADASAPTRTFSEAECLRCHPDAAAQWERSRHHDAFTNVDFQRSYAREPTPFCRDCHAPGFVRAPALASDAARALGVGCLDCHGDGDGIVTGTSGGRDGPHAVRRTDDFGTRACKSCHEFSFPESSRRPEGTMMQTTMSEHRASEFRDRSCASCHLPSTSAGADHSLASTRDPANKRAALQIEAVRVEEGLRLSLSPRGVGHAFPTGDLYRRLELHAEALDDDGRLVAERTRYLGRHFAPYRHADGTLNAAYRWPVPDDRVTAPTEVVLPLPTTATIRWWVDYERVDERDDLHPERSPLAGEVRLAEGRI